MSYTTFACTTLLTDHGTYLAGDVIRHPNITEKWSDTIILGFSDPKLHNGDVYVKLARPFAYASCVGTTSPGVLMGQEVYEMSAAKLDANIVLTGPPMLAHGTRPFYASEVIDLRTDVKAVDASKLPSKGTKVGLDCVVGVVVCTLTREPLTKGTIVYSWFEGGEVRFCAQGTLPTSLRDFEKERKIAA